VLGAPPGQSFTRGRDGSGQYEASVNSPGRHLSEPLEPLELAPPLDAPSSVSSHGLAHDFCAQLARPRTALCPPGFWSKQLSRHASVVQASLQLKMATQPALFVHVVSCAQHEVFRQEPQAFSLPSFAHVVAPPLLAPPLVVPPLVVPPLLPPPMPPRRPRPVPPPLDPDVPFPVPFAVLLHAATESAERARVLVTAKARKEIMRGPSI